MKSAQESDWKTEPMSSQRTVVALGRLMTEDEIMRVRFGFVPRSMENRWFIYWKDERLFFHRSWTGHCTYIARFEQRGDSWCLVDAELDRSQSASSAERDAEDARLILELVDFLVRRNPQDDELHIPGPLLALAAGVAVASSVATAPIRAAQHLVKRVRRQ